MAPLSTHMPELSAFEIFLAIARTGSLAAAGREFGLTQQAVSARLASIEAQTGVALVVRTPRGSQLTPAGVVAAEWADRLLDVARYVDAGLASLRSEKRNRIKVAASLTIAEQLIPRWLVSLQVAAARLGASVPEVIMTATNSDQAAAAVRDGTADLGFIETPQLANGITQPRGRARRAGAHRAGRSQVGAAPAIGQRSGTQPDTARHSRIRFGNPRFVDRGVTQNAG